MTPLAAVIRFFRSGTGGDLRTARHTAAHSMEQFTDPPGRLRDGHRRQVLEVLEVAAGMVGVVAPELERLSPPLGLSRILK
jgi:hypothetical protein